jgi:hypothetical protein
MICASTLTSQIETAEVYGKITDVQGMAISPASIELVNQNTGLKRTLETAQEGRYRFDFVPAGEYVLSASSPGYLAVERSITLHVASHLEADLTLIRMYKMEGEVIEAEKPREAVMKSGISSVTDEEMIDRLPYRKREYQNLAILTPGVKRGSLDLIEVFDIDVVSISGRDGGNVGYFADGISNKDYIAGIPLLEFPQESIQEYQVGTLIFDAEYGGSASGYINASTKSGTNSWSGSFFSYMKNQSLIARDYFMRTINTMKPDLTATQFGASIGGPIKVNRTHIFAAYEGTRGEDELLTVNTGGAFPDREGTFSRPFSEDMLLLKLNHNISTNKNLTVRYNQQNGLMRYMHAGGSMAVESSIWEDDDKYMIYSKYDWHRSNRFTTQFTGYYSWSRRYSEPMNPDSPVLEFPSATLGSSASSPYEHKVKKLGLGYAMSLSSLGKRGRHNLKAGLNFERVSTAFMLNPYGTGIFSYVVDDPESPPLYFVVQLGDSATDLNRNLVSLYVEDDFIVTDRLNLLMGIRYDVETGILKDYSKTPAVRFIRDNYEELQSILAANFPELGLSNGYRTAKPDFNNVSPRIGASYDLTGRGGVVLRGGWGIYYDSIYDLHGFSRLFQNQDRPVVYYMIIMPDFGPGNIPDLGDLYDPSGIGSQLSYISPMLRTPYTHQSSVGVSLSLRDGMSLEVDYMNSIGNNELKQRNLNFATEEGRLLSNDYDNIIVTESIGRSRYDALLLQFRNRFSDSFRTNLAYTLMRTNSSQNGWSTRPQDNLRPLAEVEFGPSPYDATHSLSVSVLSRFLRSFEVNSLIHVESPRPYTIITGYDENGDGWRNDMPAGVTRNSERGDWTFQWDVRVSKFFEYGNWGRSELLVDFLNITNTDNFGNFYFNTLTSEKFGQPEKAFTPPRHVQIGLRHTF